MRHNTNHKGKAQYCILCESEQAVDVAKKNRKKGRYAKERFIKPKVRKT